MPCSTSSIQKKRVLLLQLRQLPTTTTITITIIIIIIIIINNENYNIWLYISLFTVYYNNKFTVLSLINWLFRGEIIFTFCSFIIFELLKGVLIFLLFFCTKITLLPLKTNNHLTMV
jgi:hypothetical protein